MSLHFPLPYPTDREDLYQRVENCVTDHIKELQALQVPSKVSFEENLKPIEQSLHATFAQWHTLCHLQNVDHQGVWRERHQALLQKVSFLSTLVDTHSGLQNLYQIVSADPNLNPDQKLLVAQKLKSFRLHGANLPQDKKQKLQELLTELDHMEDRFAENVLDATDEWYLPCQLKDLSGLASEEQQNYFKSKAERLQLKEPAALTIDAPSYRMAMENLDNAELRKKLYLAHSALASREPHRNQEVTKKIFELRVAIAKLLGFSSYAELALQNRFAQSAKEVKGFLNQLVEKIRPRAEENWQTLEAFAREKLGWEEKLEPWDVPYVVRKHQIAAEGIDLEKLRDYFPVEHVLSNLFAFFGELYGFKVTPCLPGQTWHPEVQTYSLTDLESQQTIGFLACDLFSRPGKHSGAWMDVGQDRADDRDWKLLPVAYLVCNFRKTETPRLSFSELTTLFHEFGHCMHHLLTKRTLPAIAGINNVPQDIIELPSQLHEQWCWEPAVLQRFSRHYLTEEQLSLEQIKTLHKIRHYFIGWVYLRHLEFSLYDWLLYEKTEIDDVTAFWRSVNKTVAVRPTRNDNFFPLSFGHIFAGGYAAGYYSYLWAECYALQSYSLVKESPHGLRDFRQAFLSQGASFELKESLEAWLKSEISPDKLLETYFPSTPNS